VRIVERAFDLRGGGDCDVKELPSGPLFNHRQKD
jgi:hypothetical protein